MSSTAPVSIPDPTGVPSAALPVEPLRYYSEIESDHLARTVIRIVSGFAVAVAAGGIASFASQIWLLSAFHVTTVTQLYMICMMAALTAQVIGGVACFKYREWGRRLLLIAVSAEILLAGGFAVAAVWFGASYSRGRPPYLAVQLAGLVVQLSIPAFFLVIMRVRAICNAMKRY